MVWKADRLFCSLKAMVTTLDEWTALGVGFVSATEVCDSTTPQGKLVLHLTSAFAEFDRNRMVERPKAGNAAARKRGVHVGRPRARVDADHVRELRAEGMSVRKISTTCSVGCAKASPSSKMIARSSPGSSSGSSLCVARRAAWTG